MSTTALASAWRLRAPARQGSEEGGKGGGRENGFGHHEPADAEGLRTPKSSTAGKSAAHPMHRIQQRNFRISARGAPTQGPPLGGRAPHGPCVGRGVATGRGSSPVLLGAAKESGDAGLAAG